MITENLFKKFTMQKVLTNINVLDKVLFDGFLKVALC